MVCGQNTMLSSASPAALGAHLKNGKGLDQMLYCPDGNGFFESRLYCAHGFGMETLRVQSATGDTNFDGEATFPLAKAGDGVFHLYACVRLPGIEGCDNSGESGGGDPCSKSGSGIPASGNVPACAASDEAMALGAFPNDSGNAADATSDFFLSLGHGFMGTSDLILDQMNANTNAIGQLNTEADEAMDGGDGDGGDYDTSEVNVPQQMQLPSQQAHYAHWANAIGQVVIEQCALYISDNPIDSLFSEYLFMWQQLAGRAGKETDRMVGLYHSVDDLILASLRTRWYYVQLPFWFTFSAGHVLRLVTLVFARVKLRMKFAPLEQCIVRSSTDTKVVRSKDGKDVEKSDLHVEVAATHIWVEEDVRVRMGEQRETVMIQVHPYPFTLDSSCNRLQPVLNHACIELIWAARRKCAVDMNEHFNFSGPFNLEMLKSISMSVNGVPRVYDTEAEFFRYVHPLQYHSKIPDAYVYCYCFSLFPEDMVISGSLNFSRFETIEINVNLHANMLEDGPIEFILFTRVWNLMRNRNGSGRVLFQ